MGSATSLQRSRKNVDYEGGCRGVVKRIPIEVKPRGRLGHLSVSSFGKKSKNGSLRNALSFDLDHPEVDKVKREYEMYKMQKECEIANLEKKEQKVEMENKRMRTELQTLQKRVSKLRLERDAAAEAERQAMARSATFESERDKVQRQFKIFRETKENEIQNLLKAKRQLEVKVGKGQLGHLDHAESASKATLIDTSLGTAGDWWAGLESEPSMGSTTQLNQVVSHINDQGHHELDGSVVDLNKELYSPSLSFGLPEIQLTTIRLYLSIPPDLHQEQSNLFEHYLPKLRLLCEREGRYLLPVHFTDDKNDEISNEESERMTSTIARQVQRSAIFVAFLGSSLTRYTAVEYRVAHLSTPSFKPAIFAFKDVDSMNDDVSRLRDLVTSSGGCRVMTYTGVMKVTAEVYTALERLIRIELGLPLEHDDVSSAQDEETSLADMSDGPEALCAGCVWDSLGDNQQLEAYQYALEASCEIGLDKYYDRLNNHVSSAGPLPPLLVLGEDGSGRSMLLAKWIRVQQQRPISGQIFFHFVCNGSSGSSADPTVMIRRLTSKLVQSLPSATSVADDANRLTEEFPRWLEKVSARTPGGVILVLDSIDRCQFAEKQLKWLLDPLPVDVRVIISANDHTCLTAWRSWPTIRLTPLPSKAVTDLVSMEVSGYGLMLSDTDQSRILTQCRTSDLCSPLYAMVLSSELCRCPGSMSDRSAKLDTLLSCPDCVFLYKVVLDNICLECETKRTKGVVKTILQYIYISREGLSETDLFGLIPELTWPVLGSVLDALTDRHVLTSQGGLYIIAHQQARDAIEEKYFDMEEGPSEIDSLRRDCVRYFTMFLKPGEITCRVTDELLWQLRQLHEKDRLRECLRNLGVFIRLYGRERYGDLLSYWSFTGVDKSVMANELFDSAKQYEQFVGSYDGLITLPRIADVCEAIGRFLRDIGQFSLAVPPLQHALEMRESALDPDHPKVAQALHQLANLHAQWNKLTSAEQLHKQALDIYESSLGTQHRLVAKELDSLSLLYRRQNRHELADPLHLRAVAIIRRHVGSGNTRGVRMRSAIEKRILHMEELILGSESNELARSLYQLASLNYMHNDTEAAERLFERALDVSERQGGELHIDTALTLAGLAALYAEQGRCKEAAELFERSLDIRFELSDQDFSPLVSILKSLANIYEAQAWYDKWSYLTDMAIKATESAQPEDQLTAARFLVSLAATMYMQKHHRAALPLYERALMIYENNLGRHHHSTVQTLKNLTRVQSELRLCDNDSSDFGRSVDMDGDSTDDTSQITGPEICLIPETNTGLEMFFDSLGNFVDVIDSGPESESTTK